MPEVSSGFLTQPLSHNMVSYPRVHDIRLLAFPTTRKKKRITETNSGKGNQSDGLFVSFRSPIADDHTAKGSNLVHIWLIPMPMQKGILIRRNIHFHTVLAAVSCGALK